jgi:plasmid stabilization system protein ParE
MNINFSERFEEEFFVIYKYIAEDSFQHADNFKKELMESMQILKDFPLMYRKSKKFQDKAVRDMIFKKYVIPYKIEENEILILGIFNQNLWQTK